MTETTDTHQKKAQRRRILFTALPVLFLLLGFAIYAWHGGADRILSLVSAAVLLFLYCLCIIRLIPQWQRSWSGEPIAESEKTPKKRDLRPSKLHPAFRIFFFALLSRLLIFLAVYLLHIHARGYQGGLMDLLSLWTPDKTQAADWLRLADTWYPVSGELLSLLPFYPAAVRLVSYAFGNTLIAGLLISSLAFAGSAWLVYELTLCDGDRASAMTAARWFCLLPGSLLLMLPTADSLFLLLCLCCILLARKKRYPAAAVFGMAAAFTRLSGLLLVVPVGIELVADYRTSVIKASTAPNEKKRYFAYACSMLLIPFGTALYAFLCFRITGDALYAVRGGALQINFFFSAGAQHTTALFAALRQSAFSSAIAHGMQLLHLALPILLLIFAIPRMRVSNSAYLLIYTALTAGVMPGDIPRLIVSAFALYPMLAAAFRRRFSRALVTLLLFIGLCAAVLAQAAQKFFF